MLFTFLNQVYTYTNIYMYIFDIVAIQYDNVVNTKSCIHITEIKFFYMIYELSEKSIVNNVYGMHCAH
jgi:phage-related holin